MLPVSRLSSIPNLTASKVVVEKISLKSIIHHPISALMPNSAFNIMFRIASVAFDWSGVISLERNMLSFSVLFQKIQIYLALRFHSFCKKQCSEYRMCFQQKE